LISGMTVLVDYGPQLLKGLCYTLIMAIAGSVLGLVLGFALALIRNGGHRLPNAIIDGYVEIFRGTPLLVQLFVFYYGGSTIGITLNAFTVGLMGLSLYGSAYFAEIFRAGFESLARGQTEAAISFGFSRWHTLRYVVLPQILIMIIPPSTNLMIILLKDTAVLSTITVPELTFQVTGMTAETFTFVEPFLVLAAVYWILTELTSYLGKYLERRVGGYLHT
jgi:polar amino acid transport system permease protein